MTRILDSPEIEENWPSWLNNGHYVCDHKMRTNNNWRTVEHILERRKVGESYDNVWVVGICKIWNPDHVFWTESIDKNEKMRTIRGVGPNVKIFYRRKSTLDITSSSLFLKWVQWTCYHHYFSLSEGKRKYF